MNNNFVGKDRVHGRLNRACAAAMNTVGTK
jgi:hypothetical protein